MKTLYLECKMGAAGDMLTAALLELLPDPQIFLDKINSLGIPGVKVQAEPAVKCGIRGTHMEVLVNGMEEHEYFHALRHGHAHGDDHGHHHGNGDDGHEHEHHEHGHIHEHGDAHTHEDGHGHEHGHEHEHPHGHEHTHGEPGHAHTGMAEIGRIIDGLDVSPKVRQDIRTVYGIIAEAESHSHGIPVEEVHFHEVGALDAITDITSVCLLMEMIGAEQILASPVHVGSGHVHCTHGTLPVPAPATAYILQGVPIWSGTIRGELCTPTGAALLKHFVSEFIEMPCMTVSGIGYGMGMKDFEQANCLRAMLGNTQDSGSEEQALELHCNLDDMTPEAISFAAARLLAEGALDVWTESIGMKKGRPGVKLCCLCQTEDRDTMLQLIFRHTSTIGVREHACRRFTLNRETVSRNTPFGPVRFKQSSGWGVTREKPEYEDVASIAAKKGISLQEVLKEIR